MIRTKRRIPVIPNMITTGNIFAGFYSIIQSIAGDFEKAAWAIFIGGIFDILDGRIARLTNSQSEFGVQYDSLSDLTTFGFAPALMAYFWALKPFGKIGWLAAFLYVVCAALRLARFNVQGATEEREYFQGIPSPGAAGVIVATVLFHNEYWGVGHLQSAVARVFFLVLVYCTALLMVSGIRFRTFKTFSLRGVGPFRTLVMSALLISLIAFRPRLALFVVGYAYLMMGIIETAFFLRRKSLLPDEEEETEAETSDNNIKLLPS